MNIETHLRNLKESLEVIRESIEKGLVERQRTLGFNTSAAAADMIEEKRNVLCYGKPQKEEVLQELLADFNALKEKFREAGLHEL